jgi:hypothetical protein
MKYIVLIAFVSCIILSGCIDTEGILELEGKVLDENTKVAIPNRKVTILAMLESEGEFISSHAGYFFTDSTGCFKYSLKRVKNVYIYDFCIVGDSVYAFSTKRIGLIELYRNNDFLTFNISKLTDFAIKIERKSKIPFRDTLYISWESNGKDGQILYPYKVENYWYESNNDLVWIGGKIKSVIKTKVFANKKTIIHYKLYRDGKYIGINDTTFCLKDAANNVYFTY